MSLAGVRLSLLIGETIPRPAPRLLMNALESVHVSESEGIARGFQLQFRAERGLAAGDDYALLKSGLLQPGSRVVISVTINARPRVLMDGIVTRHDLSPSGKAAGASLSVTGEDLSVLMDRKQVSMRYLSLPHEAVVLLVLLRYAAYGVIPNITSAPSAWTTNPLDQTTAQRETDLKFLRRLAKQHGYIFAIKPGPQPGISTACWGRPDQISRAGRPPKPLTVDMGPASNVDSMQFSHDGMAGKQVVGLVADPDFLLPVPVLSLVSTRIPPLSRRPAPVAGSALTQRDLLDYKGHQAGEAWAKAREATDSSTENAVTASGTLDVLRYGDLLTFPGIVGLRGAGSTYDGYYFIQSVDHTINRLEYKQKFHLRREGTGSLVNRV